LQDFICKDAKYEKAEVFFLCGSDRLRTANDSILDYKRCLEYNKNIYDLPVIIKGRPEQEDTEYCRKEMEKLRKFTKEEMLQNKIYILDDYGNYSSSEMTSLDV
jgi:hypothetical protein